MGCASSRAPGVPHQPLEDKKRKTNPMPKYELETTTTDLGDTFTTEIMNDDKREPDNQEIKSPVGTKDNMALNFNCPVVSVNTTTRKSTKYGLNK